MRVPGLVVEYLGLVGEYAGLVGEYAAAQTSFSYPLVLFL